MTDQTQPRIVPADQADVIVPTDALDACLAALRDLDIRVATADPGPMRTTMFDLDNGITPGMFDRARTALKATPEAGVVAFMMGGSRRRDPAAPLVTPGLDRRILMDAYNAAVDGIVERDIEGDPDAVTLRIRDGAQAIVDAEDAFTRIALVGAGSDDIRRMAMAVATRDAMDGAIIALDLESRALHDASDVIDRLFAGRVPEPRVYRMGGLEAVREITEKLKAMPRLDLPEGGFDHRRANSAPRSQRKGRR
jgi:hypothetical protein